MKTLILLILTLTLIACDQHYEEGEEVEFDTEVDTEVDTETETEFEEDTDTVEVDSDCLEYEACTIGYNPRCLILDDGTEVLRTSARCVCVGGVRYPVTQDRPCEKGCIVNIDTDPESVDYCVGDEDLL